jgi:hypothetical protein
MRLSILYGLVAAVGIFRSSAAILAQTSGMLLPDAPEPTASLTQQNRVLAPHFAKYIGPGQAPQRLSAGDKFKLAGHEQLQPYSFFTQALAAGWEHLLDSNPKFGTDKAGFGERLGAAALRQSSQSFFTDGLFASAFHQDPRYYRKGKGKIVGRIVYAATRVAVTRGDSGISEPNYAAFAGHAATGALTMTYYPAVSATWRGTAEGYSLSFVGTMLGYEVHEFVPDLIHLAHRSRP